MAAAPFIAKFWAWLLLRLLPSFGHGCCSVYCQVLAMAAALSIAKFWPKKGCSVYSQVLAKAAPSTV
jgi:hypothetical protein